MVRTIISLDEDDKAWLDRQAAREGRPMTALIRQALALLRARTESPARSLDDVLLRTSGLWRRGDGLAWQRRLRDEWPR